MHAIHNPLQSLASDNGFPNTLSQSLAKPHLAIAQEYLAIRRHVRVIGSVGVMVRVACRDALAIARERL